MGLSIANDFPYRCRGRVSAAAGHVNVSRGRGAGSLPPALQVCRDVISQKDHCSCPLPPLKVYGCIHGRTCVYSGVHVYARTNERACAYRYTRTCACKGASAITKDLPFDICIWSRGDCSCTYLDVASITHGHQIG